MRSSLAVAVNKRPVLMMSLLLMVLNVAFIIVMAFAMMFAIAEYNELK